MQIAFSLLMQTQEWTALIRDAGERDRLARHVKGKINVFADAESRGYHALVSDMCDQLGIRRRQLPLSDAAVQYLNAFAAETSPYLPLALQNLGVSPSCTAHDGPTLEGYLPQSEQQQQTSNRSSTATRTLEGYWPADVNPGQEGSSQAASSTAITANQPGQLSVALTESSQPAHRTEQRPVQPPAAHRAEQRPVQPPATHNAIGALRAQTDDFALSSSDGRGRRRLLSCATSPRCCIRRDTAPQLSVPERPASCRLSRRSRAAGTAQLRHPAVNVCGAAGGTASA